MSAPASGHVLVIGVDGVRFDLLGPDSTPSVWEFGLGGFLAAVSIDAAPGHSRATAKASTTSNILLSE